MSRGRVEENPRSSHLLPHAWDTYGQPPPPGATFPIRDWSEKAGKVDELLKEADEHYEDAAEKQREAYEDMDAADEALDEAIDLIETEIEPQDRGAAADLLKKVESHRKDRVLD